jgi:GNAT superfamily N-acetyltransferase
MTRLERLQVFDIAETIELMFEFNKHFKKETKLNKNKLRHLFELSVAYPNKFYCQLMKDDNKIVGFLGGSASEGIFSDAVLAHELGWFIQPEYRGHRKSLQMLKDFEQWAKEEAKADMVIMVYAETMSNLDKIYEKKGYEAVEHTYMKKFT